MAQTPAAWQIKAIPDSPFLVIPETTSERREYVPIGWSEPPVVPSVKLRIVEDATKPLFGLLTSAMHMAWLHLVGGRLESRFSYSIGIVYNTFPIPEAGYDSLEPFATTVLQARAKYPESTLADLYDPDTMPTDLRKAHRALDKAADRLYRKTPFQSNQERAAHLLSLYEAMTKGNPTP